jgi:hypothetical protein
MAENRQVEKSRYCMVMEGFWLGDNCRIIAVSNGLLEGSPVNNLPTLSPLTVKHNARGYPLQCCTLVQYQAVGLIFWFTRNRFVGSYLFLMVTNRS